jgi:hypothetical protein
MPSQYADLAPPPAWDPSKPSVYDLLAGSAPAPEVMASQAVAPETPAGEVPVAHVGATQVPVERVGEAPVLQETANEPVAEVAEVHVAPETAPDQAVEASDVPASPAGDAAHDAWNVPLDEGRFALGGWAASSGHSMVSAVTFRKRLPEDVPPERIVLDIDAADNVPEGGLIVLADPGFAPDRDGFTLLLAAAEPGPFSAAGSYRVLPTQVS